MVLTHGVSPFSYDMVCLRSMFLPCYGLMVEYSRLFNYFSIMSKVSWRMCTPFVASMWSLFDASMAPFMNRLDGGVPHVYVFIILQCDIEECSCNQFVASMWMLRTFFMTPLLSTRGILTPGIALFFWNTFHPLVA